MPMRPLFRQPLADAPEEIVDEFLRARLLEGMHLDALAGSAAHHVLDDAVLAGGVHRLQHDQHRPAVAGVKLLLQGRTAARCRRRASLWPRSCRRQARSTRPDRAWPGGTCPACRCGSAWRVVRASCARVHALSAALASAAWRSACQERRDEARHRGSKSAARARCACRRAPAAARAPDGRGRARARLRRFRASAAP